MQPPAAHRVLHVDASRTLREHVDVFVSGKARRTGIEQLAPATGEEPEEFVYVLEQVVRAGYRDVLLGQREVGVQ